ncbi:MAG: hypothetical protein ACQERZ_08655 [Fusobacteriota bacterium]
MLKEKRLIILARTLLLVLMIVTSGCLGLFSEDDESDGETDSNVIEISEDVTEDMTFSSSDSYIVEETINVKANLTIEPGTTIKFKSGTGLNLDDQQGALIAEGTADKKITFTGTSKQPGWWDGIWIKNSTNLNNKLEHVIVEYGGNEDVHRYSNPGNVIVGSGASLDSSSIEISNSTLRESGSSGLFVMSGGSLTGFSNNELTNNYRPVHIKSDQVHNLDTGSSYNNNENDFVYVAGSYPIDSEDITWNNLGVPYSISHKNNDAVEIKKIEMTIVPGVKIEFESGGGLKLSEEAALIADGTTNEKITFTGTSKQPGWWNGIFIEESSNQKNKLNHVIVEYGGKEKFKDSDGAGNVVVGSTAAYSDNSSIEISNSKLSESDGYGIFVNNKGSVVNDWAVNEFENNDQGRCNLEDQTN